MEGKEEGRGGSGPARGESLNGYLDQSGPINNIDTYTNQSV